ncbi:Alpha/Beta hydrolase protein [Mycotypha africana]|uniref:Alpha/Beta hydrolase protein n=1 Tax=Mycotypha africana TaxID=64632 RepID=UPI0023008C40|nr:Alpha/Beta hydrolase protein [Mycotypha africana]KAI8968569.1 Alpha/Beta hydrolase protein [Mycotypha africana]
MIFLKSTVLFFSTSFILNMVVVGAKLLTPSDLIQLPRPGVPVTSPNGALAVYAQSSYNITEGKSVSNLYLLNINENSVEELTKPSFEASDSEPFFLDNDHVAYMHHGDNGKEDKENESTVDQLYVLNLKNKDSYRLTDFPIPFGNMKYNLEAKLLAFSASVYNEMKTLKETLERDQYIEANKKDTAMVFDELMVRHWDAYVGEKKNNLFVVSLSVNKEGKYEVSHEPVNLLKDTGFECPAFPLGDASDYAISPDGSQIAFLAKSTAKDNAWQTTSHIYLVPTTIDESNDRKPRPINDDIPAASSSPHFIADNQLVYFQMYTPQYESDRNRIVLYDMEKQVKKLVAGQWDRSPHEIASSHDGKTLYVTAEDHGRNKIFAINIETESIDTLTEEGYATGLTVLPTGQIFYGSSSMKHPVAPYIFDPSSKEITRFAIEDQLQKKLESFDLVDAEDLHFIGSLDETVHGWYLQPAGYEQGKQYPVAFLIHGGPQGAWNDNWSTRWNPQIFAGAGYAVVAINFHGSTGYGQAFTDSIGENWGSYPFYDLEKGLEYVLQKYSYLDAKRVAGLGASYGGFMVNWINGHSDKFKVLVNHDGVFSTSQVFYTTDELYFSEKEFGGTPILPKNREGYEQWSPANFVQNWKTPTLVIHGGKDFRLTLGEGLSTFTGLQRQGIPSRLVYFPDENHWVLKPANSLRWHKEVLDWINKYTMEEEGQGLQASTNAALLYQQDR